MFTASLSYTIKKSKNDDYIVTGFHMRKSQLLAPKKAKSIHWQILDKGI